MRVDFESLLRDRRIKRVEPDQRQIFKQLERATQDLRAAACVQKVDLTWCYTIAYQAMIRAGRAFMFSRGYLPAAANSHMTIINFLREAIGPRAGDILLLFDRMRRKRHEFLYDSINDTEEEEALAAISTARELIRTIGDLV